jgi:hypothetical protein
MMAYAMLSRWLAARLMAHGLSRLGRRQPQWAQAMAGEAAYIATDDERLRWAAGCAIASYRASEGPAVAVYCAAVAIGVALMTAYQWSADESMTTVAVLTAIGLALGALEPRRVRVSGLLVGLVVAGVNAFETLTGVRPPYEDAAHTLIHDARWLVLLAPSLAAATAGGFARSTLRSVDR